MKIWNVRLGLATNSSSSHSIVWLDEPAQGDDCEYHRFGWDYFTVASKEAKRDYLALALYRSLSGMAGDEIAKMIIRQWIRPSMESFNWEDGYVDHDGWLSVPRNWDDPGVNVEFLTDLVAFIDRPNVTILGGNDNDEDDQEDDTGAE